MVFLKKNEAHFSKLPRKKEAHTQFNNCSAPFSFIQNCFSPTPIKITKERINLLPLYMTDILFTELQIHNISEKKHMKNDIPNIPSHLLYLT